MLSIILQMKVCRTIKEMVPTRPVLSQNIYQLNRRKLHTSKTFLKNYEGDGKTTVTILNQEHRHLIMFDSYSSRGFRLNNGVFVFGPMAVFPKTILQWKVQTVEDITPDKLSLFTLLAPKLDILVIGTGDKMHNLRPDVKDLLKSKNICLELLSTEKACATFNFLNAEGRCVAGAMIPPSKVVPYKQDFKFIGDDPRMESLLPSDDVLRKE